MITMSLAETKSRFVPVDIADMEALGEFITQNTYSCGIFKNNHRTSGNFMGARAIGLDFDGGLSIEKAKELFAEYQCVIAPSKSHQVEKGGKIDDRFRVLVFLSELVTDPAIYKNTIKSLLDRFPQADKNCSDAGRMFYQSKFVFQTNHTGKLVDPVVVPETPLSTVDLTDVDGLDFFRKPAGWSNCKWALNNGFFKKGEGNWAMMSLATTFKKMNYTKSMAFHLCKDAYQKRKARTGDPYDDQALWREVIGTVYGPDWKGTVYVCSESGSDLHNYCTSLGVHACPTTKSGFDFQGIGRLFTSKSELDWLVDGLLTVGGISLIAGLPKSGKSTIIRQLTRDVARGDKFLGRKVKQGRVVYLALEEQEEVLHQQYKLLGVTENDDIFLQVGPVLCQDPFEELREYIVDTRPALLIIDTISLMAGIKDINSYDETTSVIGKYRALARESGTHILCVHHQNKGMITGPSKIMGSTGIHGAVDCAIMFDRAGAQRLITTSQRAGKPFDQQPLDFNSDNQTYSLAGRIINETKF